MAYIEHHGFGASKNPVDYACGAFWPFETTFIFSDGSRYKAIVDVPNKSGFLIITCPIDPWSFDVLDDERYVLDLDHDKTNYLHGVFEDLGAYK